MMVEAVRVATVFVGSQAAPSADMIFYEAVTRDQFRFLSSNILRLDPGSDRSVVSVSTVAHPN